MKTNTLLAAASAFALISGGAALAQAKSDVTPPADETAASSTSTDTTVSSTPADTTSTTTTDTTTSATTDTTTTSATATSATSSGTAASFTTQMVTNGPVPDTAENRAKYGQPMSRAGKRTAA